MPDPNPKLFVEAIQKLDSCINKTILKEQIKSFMSTSVSLAKDQMILTPSNFSSDSILFDHILSIRIEIPNQSGLVEVLTSRMVIFIVKLDESGPQVDELEGNGGICASTNFLLPSASFDGLWESLIYDDNIKETLIRYINTCMMLSDRHIDPTLISWNKIVLLHGPPGTGKTSLCKAFAQKMSIRLSDRYTHSQLVEINSHSLFSKWFSESGILVQKMFDQIRELVEDPNMFVCVLIDEIESLSSARSASANEPSDAIRVVNAFLTQIDACKNYPNILIMTTSNVTGMIDLAFVDRADIKHFIGNPSSHAIYSMLYGSIRELEKKGLIVDTKVSGLCQTMREAVEKEGCPSNATFVQLAQKCRGFGGRTVRKLPALALTHIDDYPVTLDSFFTELDRAVDEVKKGISNMTFAA